MRLDRRPAAVLIADDESIARDIFQCYLEGLGCRVHTAGDAPRRWRSFENARVASDSSFWVHGCQGRRRSSSTICSRQ